LSHQVEILFLKLMERILINLPPELIKVFFSAMAIKPLKIMGCLSKTWVSVLGGDHTRRV
jgi:hypothetical protein